MTSDERKRAESGRNGGHAPRELRRELYSPIGRRLTAAVHELERAARRAELVAELVEASRRRRRAA